MSYEYDESYIVRPRSRRDIEQAASHLRSKMRTLPDHPHAIDLSSFINFDMADVLDYRLETVAGLDLGEEGRVDPPDQALYLTERTYQELEQDGVRARFTAAHEVGHAALHSDEILRKLRSGVALQRVKRGTIKQAFRDSEWQANTFASSLLMPRDQVRELVKGMRPALRPIAVAEAFVVSTDAAGFHLSNLKLDR